MRRIALSSLVHDRSKLVASVAGVAFAATLAMVQHALYVGFLYTTSAMISRMGGDVWIMASGTEVVDSVEPLASGSDGVVATHPCVEQIRPLVYTWAFVRKAEKTRDNLRIVGVELGTSPLVPWELVQGLPSDLQAPMRIAVDELDLDKLQIRGDPIGATMDIMGHTVHVAAITRGVRSFTLLPFVFTNIADARRLTNLSDGEVNYWVVDLKDPQCASSVIEQAEEHPEIQAMTKDDFIKLSQNYWNSGSGVGIVLAFSALLALLVGGVVVGQTLYSITKEREPELATLKALGAHNRELLGFVAWQAGLLAAVGAVLGTAGALAIGHAAAGVGLVLIFSPTVYLSGAAIIGLTCMLASAMSARRVLNIDAAEVFQ
jgi:putative ABC transport system permease protein